jgi:hypothetical protein
MLTAVPNKCSILEGWYINGKKVSSDPYLSVVKETNVIVDARFDVLNDCRISETPGNNNPSYTVNTGYFYSSPGAIISEPAGIICPGQCSHAFGETQVKLKAVPTEGNNLGLWLDEGLMFVSDKTEIIIEPSKNSNLLSRFECLENCYAIPERECNDVVMVESSDSKSSLSTLCFISCTVDW